MTHRVSELHLEQTCRNIQHTLLGIHLLTAHTNGVDEVCLTTTGGAKDIEGVEGGLSRMLSNGESHGARQFVAVTFYIIIESLLGIQLRIQGLGLGCVQCGRCLVTAMQGLGGLYRCRALTFYILRNTMTLVGDDLVREPHL